MKAQRKLGVVKRLITERDRWRNLAEHWRVVAEVAQVAESQALENAAHASLITERDRWRNLAEHWRVVAEESRK